MTRANPWAISAEQAAAREDAILEQYIAASDHAFKVAPTPERAQRMLKRQFGNAAIERAIAIAWMRRTGQP